MPKLRLWGGTHMGGLSDDRTLPAMRISPASGTSSPATQRSRVVLPDPLAPTITNSSPSFTSRSTALSAVTRPFITRNSLVSRRSSIMRFDHEEGLPCGWSWCEHHLADDLAVGDEAVSLGRLFEGQLAATVCADRRQATGIGQAVVGARPQRRVGNVFEDHVYAVTAGQPATLGREVLRAVVDPGLAAKGERRRDPLVTACADDHPRAGRPRYLD